jgi:hypothetical protein
VTPEEIQQLRAEPGVIQEKYRNEVICPGCQTLLGYAFMVVTLVPRCHHNIVVAMSCKDCGPGVAELSLTAVEGSG